MMLLQLEIEEYFVFISYDKHIFLNKNPFYWLSTSLIFFKKSPKPPLLPQMLILFAFKTNHQFLIQWSFTRSYQFL